MIACRTLGQWNKVNVGTGYVGTVGIYDCGTFDLYMLCEYESMVGGIDG